MDGAHAGLNFKIVNSDCKYSSSSSFSKLCKLKQILDYVAVPKLLEPLLPESESEEGNTSKALLSMPLLSLVNLNLLLSSSQSDQKDTFNNNNQSQEYDDKLEKVKKITRPRVKKEGYTSVRTKDDSYLHPPLHTSRLFKMVTKVSRNEISHNSTKSSDADNSQEYDVQTNNQLSQSAYYPFRCSSRASTCSSTCSSLSSSIFSPVPSPTSSYSSSQSSSDEFLYSSPSYLSNNMSSNLIPNISFNQFKDCPNVNKILKHYRKKFNMAMKPLNKYELTFKSYPSYLEWSKREKCVNEKPDQQCDSRAEAIKNEIEQLLRSFSHENKIKQQMDGNGQFFYSIPADIQEIIS